MIDCIPSKFFKYSKATLYRNNIIIESVLLHVMKIEMSF